jgi:hypothetical protein
MPYSGGSNTALSSLGSGTPEASALSDTTADNASAKLFDVTTTASAVGKVKHVQLRTNQIVPAGVSCTITIGPLGTETVMLRMLDGELAAAGQQVESSGQFVAKNGDDIKINWSGGAAAATDVDVFVQYEDDANVTIA